jgi:hypothetical protein
MSPARASAEDFTFRVPANVTGLPAEINGVGAACNVLNEAGEVIASGVSEVQPVGGDVPPSGRTFASTLTVAFDAGPSADPSQARRYTCHVFFRADLSSVGGLAGSFLYYYPDAGGVIQSQPFGSPQPPARLPQGPGGPYTLRAEGSLSPTPR